MRRAISRILQAIAQRIVAPAAPVPDGRNTRARTSVGKLDCPTIAAMYLQGEGIEIGALHEPMEVPSNVRVRYVDRMTVEDLRTHYPELSECNLTPVDIVDDAERLATIPDNSQGFVIANGVLEHLENPLLAAENMFRVLEPGGVLFLAVPDKRHTFDAPRETTPLDHLLAEYEGKPVRDRGKAFREWAEYVQNVDGAEAIEERAEALMAMDYSIHHHVWTDVDVLDLVAALDHRLDLRFTVELIVPCRYELIVVLRKEAPESPR